MGIGPVEAIKIALARSGLKKDEIDIWDVNEVRHVSTYQHISIHVVMMSRPSRPNGCQYRKSSNFRTIRVTCLEGLSRSLIH
jgi:hypothetical protein